MFIFCMLCLFNGSIFMSYFFPIKYCRTKFNHNYLVYQTDELGDNIAFIFTGRGSLKNRLHLLLLKSLSQYDI